MLPSPFVPTNIACLGLEGMLYGVFFTLFVLYSVFRPRRARPRVILYSSLFCFAIVSTHWFLSVAQFIQGYTSYRGNAPAEYSSDVSWTLEVAKGSMYLVLLITGDLTMVSNPSPPIFRLWAVWNKDKRVVVLPIFVLVAQCMFMVIFMLQSFSSNADSIRSTKVYVAAMEPGIIGLCVTTLCINLPYSISLIAYRISRLEKSTGSIGSGFGIVSGEFGVIQRLSHVPFIGIAFMMVNVRVDIHRFREVHTAREVPE
ncbi:hypothetical protein BD779DRAFT_1674163 [Infundibulicybe gibba]|nr:hypothetical protein BD779DRAFT_1674163 [Infundibulicybe gibba]